MSLHVGLLMVKADIRENMNDVFTCFDYKPILPSLKVSSLDDANKEMQYPRPDKPRELVHKAVAFLNGWTVILDPELVMSLDSDKCLELSNQANAEVFSMICEGGSGTYAFSLIKQNQQRVFFSVAGEVHQNTGEPIPEETGINLSNIFEDDILKIMARFGVNFSDLEAINDFDIWELDESGMAPPQQEEIQPKITPEPEVKVWWKFWE